MLLALLLVAILPTLTLKGTIMLTIQQLIAVITAFDYEGTDMQEIKNALATAQRLMLEQKIAADIERAFIQYSNSGNNS